MVYYCTSCETVLEDGVEKTPEYPGCPLCGADEIGGIRYECQDCGEILENGVEDTPEFPDCPLDGCGGLLEQAPEATDVSVPRA